MDNEEQLYHLLRQAAQPGAGPEVFRALRALITADPTGDVIEKINAFHAGEDTPATPYNRPYWQEVVQEILVVDKKVPAQVYPLPEGRRRWMPWIAAAAVIIALGIIVWYIFPDKAAAPAPLVQTVPNDVPAPAGNRAMVTLANGQRLYLDSMAEGAQVDQQGVRLVKLADGQITYSGEAASTVYNTLSNPRGSRVIDMTLADGSHVWLNAGSSITYPIVFTGNERRVTINGEAYFEVAHNAAKPFIVAKGEMEVKVLGTHFNVNAYDDESEATTTLVEGKVKVFSIDATTRSVVLRPGQQAVQPLNGSKVITVHSNVDLGQALAWKNGIFNFTGVGLKAVMRQLERWYDIEVQYKGAVLNMTFDGSMYRDVSLSNVLNFLKEAGLHFRLEGKKLVILE